MNASYRNPTLQFLYPEGWSLDENQTSDGSTVSLQSPYSMFLFLNCYEDAVEPQHVADQALKTMQDEYTELDAEPAEQLIAGAQAVGYDVNFFSLDLTNTCWIRAFSAGSCTVLIFAQTSDLDLERAERAFHGICASVKLGTPDSD
jgi:hypothetical protein